MYVMCARCKDILLISPAMSERQHVRTRAIFSVLFKFKNNYNKINIPHAFFKS